MKLDSQLLSRLVWFLDYDGSLCPHQEVWETRAYDPVEISKLLERLKKKSANLLWNTGRRAESLAGLNPSFLDYSGYFVQGTFFWDAQTRQNSCLAPPLPNDLGPRLTDHFESVRDYRLEIKPTSLRIAPVHGASMSGVSKLLSKFSAHTPAGWHWILGHRGAELLPDGFNKGSALLHALAQSPSETLPVAVGDDFLDRPAVEIALKRGGFAVLVGDGCGWITEVAHHPWQIITCQTPAALHDWMNTELLA